MERTEFEKLVVEGFAQLPAWVREKIRNVALLVEDEPSEEVRRVENLPDDVTLLGYYQGTPLVARNYDDGLTLPDTITLFKIPVEEEALATGMDVRQVIAETIWHEFAHHFGMDEDEVQEEERKRDGKS